MAQNKFVTTTVGTLILTFFLAVNLSMAQEQTVKAADATEAVSTVKEVKSVPAKLVKAMDAAKTNTAKAGKSGNRQTMFVWYPTPGNQTGCSTSTIDQTLYPVATYPTVEDLPRTLEPAAGCTGSNFCCAKGYSREEDNFTIATIDGEDYWVPVSATPNNSRTKN